MKEIIKAAGLTKVYSSESVMVPAVTHVNLTITSGEFTAVVGPSGSGKTTLLNLIGGIDRPTSGKVWINGKEITAMTGKELTKFRRDHIGFVFQQYNLLPVLTVLENVEFIMELQGLPASLRKQRAVELLKAVGLENKLYAKPAQLSGGQQQRVAVARALAHKPKFIIADETTANLDSRSTADLLSIMDELNQQEGVTFIFSTHDQRVVDRARRIIEFQDGKIKTDVHKLESYAV